MICSNRFTPQSNVSLVTEMEMKPLKPVAKSSHAELHRQKLIKLGRKHQRLSLIDGNIDYPHKQKEVELSQR